MNKASVVWALHMPEARLKLRMPQPSFLTLLASHYCSKGSFKPAFTMLCRAARFRMKPRALAHQEPLLMERRSPAGMAAAAGVCIFFPTLFFSHPFFPVPCTAIFRVEFGLVFL